MSVYEIPLGDENAFPPPAGRRAADAAPADPFGAPPAFPAPASFGAGDFSSAPPPAQPAAMPAFGDNSYVPPAFTAPAASFDPSAFPPPGEPTHSGPSAANNYATSAEDLFAIVDDAIVGDSFAGGLFPAPAAKPLAAPAASLNDFPPPSSPDLSSFPAPSVPAADLASFPAPAAAPAVEAPAAPSPLLRDEADPQPGEGQFGSHPDLVAALNAVVLAGASDLHISAKTTPLMRVDGSLRPVPGTEVWSAAHTEEVLMSILSERQQEEFAADLELDLAYQLSPSARFRVNLYRQRNNFGGVMRLIPTRIKPLAELNMPEGLAKFAALPRGLVLVTGPTGSGKSTTLAAIIDLVNETRADHIVTVEDPIEFMHPNKQSLVNQREVGADTHSFANALKHVLRQDPDVILIGELRDLETISVALTAAETGHLVFATLHTQDAAQSIDRILDVFPPHQQSLVRTQLASTLQGIVCQTLVKRIGGGRVVATEVLMTTPAISNLIREGKVYQIPSMLQAGRENGMHTMDQHLADLVNAGQISHAAAHEKAHDIEDLRMLIQRGEREGASAGGMH